MARPHQPDAEWGTLTAHVDDSYPTLMPNGWAIGTFIFLTKVRSHGGAFIYFSGSPLRNRPARDHGPAKWHRDLHPFDQAQLSGLQADISENAPGLVHGISRSTMTTSSG